MWNNGFCNFDFFGIGPWHAGGIFHLLFWGLIIWLMVGLLQKIFVSGKPTHSDDPLGILKRRYAAGEIDQLQFEEMKSKIK